MDYSTELSQGARGPQASDRVRPYLASADGDNCTLTQGGDRQMGADHERQTACCVHQPPGIASQKD